MMGYSPCGNARQTFGKKLRGQSQLRMDDIDVLIRVTGMTYEQLFR